jgi:hypothetical protein
LWEIKPDNPAGLAVGMYEVSHYIRWSYTPWGTNLPSYTPGSDSILPGGSVLLAGSYGWYEYRLGAPGVILYDFSPSRTTLQLDFASYFATRAMAQLRGSCSCSK